jgi:hypothetical protein
VDVTDEHVARIPGSNINVSREDFGVFWRQVEVLLAKGRWSDDDAQYLLGVVRTCRWLADQTHRTPSGSMEVPKAPISGRQVRAMPETIEEEVVAAIRVESRSRVSYEKQQAAGTLATLSWAWHGVNQSPVQRLRLAS